jgi:hypothetical protein
MMIIDYINITNQELAKLSVETELNLLESALRQFRIGSLFQRPAGDILSRFGKPDPLLNKYPQI